MHPGAPRGRGWRGDRPRGDRPHGDRPRGDRPYGDRPRGDRPYGDRPRGDRPYGDRPRGDRPYGGPHGDRRRDALSPPPAYGDRRGPAGAHEYASFAVAAEEDEPPPGGFDAAYGALAAKLAAAKAPLDAIRDWEGLAESLNYYRGAQRVLAKAFPGSRITNAGMKMYEMATRLRLADFAASLGRPLRAFCNAELPGSFVSALGAYASRAGFELDWRASSYWVDEPGSSILGDMFGLYRDNPDRWLMGPGAARPPAPASGVARRGGAVRTVAVFDELDARYGGEGLYISGDMTDPAQVEAVAAAARAAWGAGADLYTSDAGIFTDYAAGESDQEADTAILNLGQTIAGLLALAPGGRLVTKTYTLFRPESRALVGWLAGLFDEFRVDKPATSKPLNSEVYLVGVGFRPERLDGAAALAAMREWRRGGRPPPGPGPAEPAGLLAAERALAASQADHLAEAVRLAAAGRRGDPDAARRRSARWLSVNFA